MSENYVIHWYSTERQLPENASYVLVRQDDDDGVPISFEAAFENGCFWYLLGDQDRCIDPKTITGWAWLPYAER